MKRLSAFLAALLVSLLFLTACTDDNGDKTATDPSLPAMNPPGASTELESNMRETDVGPESTSLTDTSQIEPMTEASGETNPTPSEQSQTEPRSTDPASTESVDSAEDMTKESVSSEPTEVVPTEPPASDAPDEGGLEVEDDVVVTGEFHFVGG